MQVLLMDDGVAARMEGLEGHAKAWREGKSWADVEMMAMGACAYAGKGTAEADIRRACELMCKVCLKNGYGTEGLS